MCTEDDLEFLKKNYMDGSNRDRTMTDPDFKNASVITSLNGQKDQINKSHSLQFAKETGQQLTHFYSIDNLGNPGLGHKKRGSRASKKPSASVDIPIDIQKKLWDSSPHSSEHFQVDYRYVWACQS